MRHAHTHRGGGETPSEKPRQRKRRNRTGRGEKQEQREGLDPCKELIHGLYDWFTLRGLQPFMDLLHWPHTFSLDFSFFAGKKNHQKKKSALNAMMRGDPFTYTLCTEPNRNKQLLGIFSVLPSPLLLSSSSLLLLLGTQGRKKERNGVVEGSKRRPHGHAHPRTTTKQQSNSSSRKGKNKKN